MKKIILVSVLFGLVLNPAFATRYKTSSFNCDRDAMLAQLDGATAEHRAVITEISCDGDAARAAKRYGFDKMRYDDPDKRVSMEQVTTSEVFVTTVTEEVERVEYREETVASYPTVLVFEDDDEFDCDCDDCDDCDECDDCADCDDEITEPVVIEAPKNDTANTTNQVVKTATASTVSKPTVCETCGKPSAKEKIADSDLK